MSRRFCIVTILSLIIGGWTISQVLRQPSDHRQRAGSNSAQTASIPVALTNTGTTPNFDLGSISPAVVASLESEVASTTAAIARVRQELSDSESELHAAEHDEKQIPGTIDELSAELTELEIRVPDAREESRSAKAALFRFSESVAQRKGTVREVAASSAAAKYRDDVQAIKQARRKRDELRTQIGARSSTQDESILENNKIRRARDIAEGEFARDVIDREGAIDAEGNLLEQAANTATDKVVRLENRSRDARAELTSERAKLASLPTRISTARERVASLTDELERLLECRTAQTSNLSLARAELQRRRDDKLLALERTRATDASRAQFAAYADFGSAEIVPIVSGNGYSTVPTRPLSSSRYYDPSYRPLVGENYVPAHVRRNGSFVTGHYRTDSDDSFFNNWSTIGNVNPHTGHVGNRLPPLSIGGGGSTYVQGHFRSNGTYVRPHYRRSR